MLAWFKKTWSLFMIVILATLICGPASRWIVANVGPGFAQAALVIDGLAAIAIVLLFVDFMLDNRKEWGIFPALDLNKAIRVAIHGDPENQASPLACAITFAATVALIITVLFLAIPRANELPVMQTPTVQEQTTQAQAEQG